MTIDYKQALDIYAQNYELDESEVISLLQDIGLTLEQAERIVEEELRHASYKKPCELKILILVL
jgi:hypothetical protein